MNKGTRVVHQAHPGRFGTTTGKIRELDDQKYVQVQWDDGALNFEHQHVLIEHFVRPSDLEGCFKANVIGKVQDLRSLLALHKLTGNLFDHLYSMRSGRIEFMPHQFKPVVKFINSPSQRTLIADEVGLGKTIEAALIWQELQAREQAKPLLIVCPKMLAEKWEMELVGRFDLPAMIVGPQQLKKDWEDFSRLGKAQSFIRICSYPFPVNLAGSSYKGTPKPRSPVLQPPPV